MAALAAGWWTVRVFISSAFRDMQAEREWLRTHVVPVPEERFRRS